MNTTDITGGSIIARSSCLHNGWVLVRHEDGIVLMANIRGGEISKMMKYDVHLFNLGVSIPNGTNPEGKYWGYLYVRMDVLLDRMERRFEPADNSYMTLNNPGDRYDKYNYDIIKPRPIKYKNDYYFDYEYKL